MGDLKFRRKKQRRLLGALKHNKIGKLNSVVN